MINIFRSLRWRLQLWHAMILFVVIAGMVGVLSWEIGRSHWDTIDEELVSAARLLEGSLRLVPQPILESLSKDLRMPPGPRLPPYRSNPDRSNPDRRPPRPSRFAPPERPTAEPPSQPVESQPLSPDSGIDWDEAFGAYPIPESEKEWESQLAIPDALPRPIGRPGSPLYFVIWRSDGSVLKQSTQQRAILPPSDRLRDQLRSYRYVATQQRPYREIII